MRPPAGRSGAPSSDDDDGVRAERADDDRPARPSSGRVRSARRAPASCRPDDEVPIRRAHGPRWPSARRVVSSSRVARVTPGGGDLPRPAVAPPGASPASTSTDAAQASALAPEWMTATVRPASSARSAALRRGRWHRPARPAECVQRCITRIASRTSSSGHGDDPGRPAQICSMASGSGIRGATPSTNVSARLGGDTGTGLERQQRGRGALGDDADDLGRQPEQVAHAHQPADPRAHPDRDVDDVEVGTAVEQLEGVRRHAEDEVRLERLDHRAGRARPPAPGRAHAPPGSRRRARSRSAPSAAIAAFFSVLLPSGTTIVTGCRAARPANARHWPWLPRVALTIPARSGCSRRQAIERVRARRAP